MLEVILDTETTGLSVLEKHRIVEIGCIELKNQIPTGKIYHQYINPQRSVSESAYKIHGYSDEFLSNQKIFSEIAESFVNFIKSKKIIIHNASFDLSFLDYELKFISEKTIDRKNVIDTLELARNKFPGSSISLDALCKRYRIDNTRRVKHTAIIDCELLAKVYVNLIDQKEPTLDFDSNEKEKLEIDFNNLVYCKKIVYPNEIELKKHKSFIKSKVNKNFFN